jgi:hypothetical protein
MPQIAQVRARHGHQIVEARGHRRRIRQRDIEFHSYSGIISPATASGDHRHPDSFLTC